MAASKPLISLIVPAYNEALNIEWFYKALQNSVKSLGNYKFEYIFIDDGSKDETLTILQKLTASDTAVRYIGFSRNFGKEAATSAGIQAARGDAVIIMDADGQHPPSLIKSFLEDWEKGNEVVIGMRAANTKEGAIKRYGSKIFYKLLAFFVGEDAQAGATDFRLLDRKVINEFLKLTERNRMTRSLIDWIGFKRSYISFVAPARHQGEASYNYSKLLKLALHGFVSQTTKPLQFAGILGFFVTTVSLLATAFVLVENYILGDPINLDITGTAMLALFLSFLVGLVLICQWLLALYIESIHTETQNRPLYIISKKSE